MLNQCEPHAIVREGVKTLRMDDVLWDILGMASNVTARTSLRATGAFSAPGWGLTEEPEARVPVPSEEGFPGAVSEVVSLVDGLASDFLGSCGHDERRFYDFVLENGARGLSACLCHICLGGREHLEEAIEIAAKQDGHLARPGVFGFIIGDKGDAVLVREWCERRLAEGKGVFP